MYASTSLLSASVEVVPEAAGGVVVSRLPGVLGTLVVTVTVQVPDAPDPEHPLMVLTTKTAGRASLNFHFIASR